MPEKPAAGIDVSKDFSDMCIISPGNKIFQTVHIFHDATSLQRALTTLMAAEHEFGEKPVIVMESTAHYHRVIAQFMQSSGYEVIRLLMFPAIYAIIYNIYNSGFTKRKPLFWMLQDSENRRSRFPAANRRLAAML